MVIRTSPAVTVLLVWGRGVQTDSMCCTHTHTHTHAHAHALACVCVRVRACVCVCVCVVHHLLADGLVETAFLLLDVALDPRVRVALQEGRERGRPLGTEQRNGDHRRQAPHLRPAAAAAVSLHAAVASLHAAAVSLHAVWLLLLLLLERLRPTQQGGGGGMWPQHWYCRWRHRKRAIYIYIYIYYYYYYYYVCFVYVFRLSSTLLFILIIIIINWSFNRHTACT